MSKYIVQIKGTREPFLVDGEKGKPILQDWLNYKQGKGKNLAFSVDGFHGSLADIKYIHEQKEPKRENVGKETNQKYLAERQAKLKLSPEERAKQTGFFELAYFGMKGERELPATLKEKVIEAQTAFFKENPNRTLADITYPKLKELLWPIVDSKTEQQAQARKVTMNIVEKSLWNDMSVAV